MENELYAVIMAGGKGERFWPQSRASKPKQLLRLVGDLTLIEQTVERLTPLVDEKNILIITNQDYVPPMHSLLPGIPEENILGEPLGRDTAPCIALAAALIQAKTGNPDAVMITLPADHVIKDTDSMLRVLEDSARMAVEGNIVTVGVKPSFASTGYGYIHLGDERESQLETVFHEAREFKEKPDTKTAVEFLKEGCYRWNSGMFIWTISTIMDAFAKHAPKLEECARNLKKAAGNPDPDLENAIRDEYEKQEKISIDYAVMEHASNVIVAECSFDWDDVGSWTALRNQIRPSENDNIIRGLHMGLDTDNCIMVGDPSHLISTIDVSNLIIVHTEDVTLVADAKSAQRVKELVKKIGQHPEMARFL